MSPGIVLLLFFLLTSTAIWWLGKRFQRSRVIRFRERSESALRGEWEIWRRKEGLSDNEVQEALLIVEEALEVPREKLGPTDDFASDLAPERGWEFDDAIFALGDYLKSRSQAPLTQVRTVGDFVKAFHQSECNQH